MRRSATLATSAIFLVMLGLAYAAAIGVSLMTRFDGGLAYMWLATGVLGPVLAQRDRRTWGRIAVVAVPISAALTTLTGLGPVAALPLALLNFSEAAIFALVMQRWAPLRNGALRSIGQVAALVGGGISAAFVVGPAAAFVAYWVTSTDIAAHLVNWLTGHVLGTIAIAPIVLLLLNGDLSNWWREAGRGELIEAGAHAALVGSVALASFSQAILPTSFLPLLPVMLATFRLGRVGAVMAMLILATIAIFFSLKGMGPVALMPPDPTARIHMVQFYLATVALTVLPAAADLRRRKDILARLAASEARYRLVTENASDVELMLDVAGDIRFVSPSIEGMGDYRIATLIGTPASALIAPEQRPLAVRAHLDALRSPGVTHAIEVRTNPETATNTRWIEMRVRVIEPLIGDGPVEIVCAIRDITQRKAVEAELQRAARTDPLTGLANRRLFNETVDALMAQMKRDDTVSGCIAVFDLDHFKAVNDRYGHDAGDRVLERFAAIAARNIRGRDLFARLGGEEFGLVLSGVDGLEAQTICERVRCEFSAQPTMLSDGCAVWTTVSAGVAPIMADSDRSEVMRLADAALYAAKRNGRDRLVLAA